jgi:hypothetical protein
MIDFFTILHKDTYGLSEQWLRLFILAAPEKTIYKISETQNTNQNSNFHSERISDP